MLRCRSAKAPQACVMFQKFMKKILVEILEGVIVILAGSYIYFGNSPSIYGYPLPKSLGILFICAGLFWIIYVLVYRNKLISGWKKAEEKEKIVICPECLKPQYLGDNKAQKCRDCKTDLEDLDGFYERHPELKERT